MNVDLFSFGRFLSETLKISTSAVLDGFASLARNEGLPASQRVWLLEELYFDDQVEMSTGLLLSYLQALRGLPRSHRLLRSRGSFLVRALRDLELEVPWIAERLSEELDFESVVEILSCMTGFELLDLHAFPDLSNAVRQKVALWRRFALLQHAVVLAFPLPAERTIVSELSPYWSVSAALDDWPYRSKESTEFLVEICAISNSESAILVEFGVKLDSLGSKYESTLATVWFQETDCLQAAAGLRDLFSSAKNLFDVFLPPGLTGPPRTAL
jgi:hypothetical protein